MTTLHAPEIAPEELSSDLIYCATDIYYELHFRPLFLPVNFTLKAGEALWVMGENGSGKSTLLRFLAGLGTPTRGGITLKQQCIKQHAAAYTKNLHYLAHANGLKLDLTVAENLRLRASLFSEKAKRSALLQKEAEVLTALHLHHELHKVVRHLSAGQKRRFSLSKLWLYPRKIWILDEPLTALDQGSQAYFLAGLKSHLQNKGIAIISSHQVIESEHTLFKKIELTAC